MRYRPTWCVVEIADRAHAMVDREQLGQIENLGRPGNPRRVVVVPGCGGEPPSDWSILMTEMTWTAL
jgi:hypothetical protein